MPPVNSVFYRNDVDDDVDLFYELEQTIIKYQNMGKVFIVGDLNSRTGERPDYITNDSLDSNLTDLLRGIDYVSDDHYTQRNNMDKGINTFGHRLLSLCKSSGLRIVNGRHLNDQNGNFTFCGTNGLSLIDYLVTKSENFTDIYDFCSGNFTEFSDHSPLHFSLKFRYIDSSFSIDTGNIGRKKSISVVWNTENTRTAVNNLEMNVDRLLESTNVTILSQSDMNDCVKNFCNIINECVLPCCDVKTAVSNRSNLHKKESASKPWFNDQCKKKFKEYKEALQNFNRCKSRENHGILIEKKSKYKKFEFRMKRQYKRYEGNMMSYLKRHNPKEFYKIFSKRNSSSKAHTDISMDQFVEHFRNLSNMQDDLEGVEPGFANSV
ncbi:hypothetical protein FSP39_025128 [Pinctada imbricata]|uniref:Endonuclease/exonuclease/phosphatase domain-containing protein n=1 Tax=Pinctada imbricata TaxID=66713 RepID=A0AA88Y6J3_PINIB|nr:hypothetical protein FSP39_025128 [Pinctada imbricata]